MSKHEGIGASSKRREDVRFLTGAGRYTDDMNRPGQTHVAFLRSQVAHGPISRAWAACPAAG
jgi:carbon-monoxide dehydrogenase large subunit